MILLPTQSLQVVAAAACNLECYVGGTEYTPAPASVYVEQDANVTTTSATDLLSAPATGYQRDVVIASLFNADTGPAVVTIRINNNGTIRRLWSGTIPAGGTLWWSRGLGWSVPGVGTGGIAGLRNKLINGGPLIDQRNAGASQTYTAGAALAYGVDRWYGFCSGANVTGQRVSGTAPHAYLYRYTGAASCSGITHGQRIEKLNCQDLAGVTATLSSYIANSLLTSVTWTAYYATTDDSFGTRASPTRTQIATGTWTVNGTLSRYSAQISVPAGATTGIEIVLSVGSQTSGTWDISDVQLEAGAAATDPERRPIGLETALCQRHYLKSYNQTSAPGAVTSAGAVQYAAAGTGGEFAPTVTFQAHMRASPTMTIFNPVTGASGSRRDLSNSTNESVSGPNVSGEYGFSGLSGTGHTSGHIYQYHWTAEAEL